MGSVHPDGDHPVAHPDGVDVYPGGGHRFMEPEVGHHSDHDGPPCQQAPLGEVGGKQRQQTVPVDDVPRGIDGDHAVSVTVEGQAKVRPFAHHGLGQATRVGRAATVVDVGPVRLG